MFLDGQLRALAQARRSIALRGELSRRLMGLETALAQAVVRRRLRDLTLGLGLAKWLLGLFGGRGLRR